MITIEEAYKIALNESMNDNLVSVYENKDNYVFVFAPEEDKVFFDLPFIRVNKESGDVDEIYGMDTGIIVSTYKERTPEEVKMMSKF